MDATNTNKEVSRVPHMALMDRNRVTLASEELKEPLLSIKGHDGTLSAVESALDATNAPAPCDEINIKSEEDHSQINTANVQSDQTRENGIPLFQGLIERVRRTVRGSSDDIGWLQRAKEMPPVEDGIERFTNILENIRNDVHMLPNTMVYLLVPGLFSNHGPLYFTTTKAYFSKLGLICHIAMIHSEGVLQALEDLTYNKRSKFLKKHPLPKELPVVSFHTESKISPSALATLTRIAQAELPTLASLSAPVLPGVIPFGATLAACAQLLQTRYREKSDGLVTCRDAEVPVSVVVHPKRKLDHAWMVYCSKKDDPSEADASLVCEALLSLVMEVSLRKNHLYSIQEE